MSSEMRSRESWCVVRRRRWDERFDDDSDAGVGFDGFGGSDDWAQAFTAEVGADLKAGVNTIAVLARNDGGIAAMSFRLTAGKTVLAESGANWKTSLAKPAAGWEATGFDDAKWTAATDDDFGIADAVLGEMVKAFVALRPGFEAGETLRRELLAHARRRLGPDPQRHRVGAEVGIDPRLLGDAGRSCGITEIGDDVLEADLAGGLPGIEDRIYVEVVDEDEVVAHG